MTNQFDDVVVLVRLRWTQMLLQQLQRFVHQKRKKDKKARETDVAVFRYS